MFRSRILDDDVFYYTGNNNVTSTVCKLNARSNVCYERVSHEPPTHRKRNVNP